jgi:hypothetical protein
MTRVRRRDHRLDCEALEGRQLLSGYYFVNAASGKVLDDPGGSTSNGAVIQQYQLDGGFNQQWTLNRVKGADFQFYDQIVNVSSGKVLDGVNGTKIVQNPPNSAAVDELWTLTKLQDGNYVVENVASKLVLEDPNSSPSNGTSVIEDQYKGGLNQQWVLVAAQAGSGRAATYTVQNSSSNQVLDDPNSSTSNGTGIIQYHRDGGANQNWTFVPLANGNDVIVNQSSGLVLGDPGFSRNKGCGIIQWQLNVGLSEQWQVHEQRNGTYEILNAYSKLVLEDPRSSTSEGIQMDQWMWNGTSNQEWYLKPVR